MLNLLISDAHNRLRIYQQKLHGYRNSVIQNTSTADAKSLDNAIKYSTNTYKTRRRIELDKKYKNTRSYRQRKHITNTWVKNISDNTLTDEQIHVLGKGLNYNTKDASKLDYIADLQKTLS